ncbi:MAG: IS701 family transposase, partial [Cyanobacteria bacterium P01_E01_bin.48]
MKSTELIGYYWSNKEHRVMRGIPLIRLYYTDPHGVRVPVNYRLYDKQEEKSKNDYFRDMVAEVLAWGLLPASLTTDAWYASRQNLRYLKDQTLTILMGIGKNRLVSLDGQPYVQIQTLSIPTQGVLVH